MAKIKAKDTEQKKSTFEQTYPSISQWVEHGWIEIGQVDGVSTFIVALDEGGMVGKGKRSYKTVEEAFQDLEKNLSKWIEENW